MFITGGRHRDQVSFDEFEAGVGTHREQILGGAGARRSDRGRHGGVAAF
jgi:hypothetical protein